MIKALIVDDDPLVSGFLSELLTAHDITVFGIAQTVSEGIRLCDTLGPPHVVLLDVFFTGNQEVSGIQQFKLLSKNIKVISLTSDPSPHTLNRCLNSGADGFLQKCVYPETIVSACKEVAAGNFFIATQGRPDLSKLGKPLLTARESEVGQLLRRGLSNKEIASTLHLSESAVKKYIGSILTKLGVSTRVEAARLL